MVLIHVPTKLRYSADTWSSCRYIFLLGWANWHRYMFLWDWARRTQDRCPPHRRGRLRSPWLALEGRAHFDWWCSSGLLWRSTMRGCRDSGCALKQSLGPAPLPHRKSTPTDDRLGRLLWLLGGATSVKIFFTWSVGIGEVEVMESDRD
jgi:hypothetical protein